MTECELVSYTAISATVTAAAVYFGQRFYYAYDYKKLTGHDYLPVYGYGRPASPIIAIVSAVVIAIALNLITPEVIQIAKCDPKAGESLACR